jgi:hypothetical protein
MRTLVVWLIGCLLLSTQGSASEGKTLMESGLLAHEFELTLEQGIRGEVLGPIFAWEHAGERSYWGLNPLWSKESDLGGEISYFDFLYPVLTYRRYGEDARWQFFQVLNFVQSSGAESTNANRFSIFPFYLQQRSSDTNQNYTSVLPFYGKMKDRFHRDEIQFFMFPVYLESRKSDVETRNYLFPVFHTRQGNSLKGWQLWPIYGIETKGLTQRTNTIDELETVGGYEKSFALWPVFLRQKTGLGTTNEAETTALLPAFSIQRSLDRDSTSIAWPLFTYTEDRQKQYREWDFPWPLMVVARGSGKTGHRIWPLYSRFSNTNLTSGFFLWPFYKYNSYQTSLSKRERHRAMYFLYSQWKETQKDSGKTRTRMDLWPLFFRQTDFNGRRQFQVLALLEPFWPQNRAVRRCYSPLWAIWRSERDSEAQRSSHSILWNLARWETVQDNRKGSFLFGLARYHATSEGVRWRLFYLPAFGGKKPQADASSKP